MSFWDHEIKSKYQCQAIVGDWFEYLTKEIFFLEDSDIADLKDANGLEFEVKCRYTSGWCIHAEQFHQYDHTKTIYVLWRWYKTRLPSLYTAYKDPHQLKSLLARNTKYGLVVPAWFIGDMIGKGLLKRNAYQYQGSTKHWYYFSFKLGDKLMQPYICNGEFTGLPKWEVHDHVVDKVTVLGRLCRGVRFHVIEPEREVRDD